METEFALDTEEGMLSALKEMIEVHGVQRVMEGLQQTVEETEEEALDETVKTELANWAVMLETVLSRSDL